MRDHRNERHVLRRPEPAGMKAEREKEFLTSKGGGRRWSGVRAPLISKNQWSQGATHTTPNQSPEPNLGGLIDGTTDRYRTNSQIQILLTIMHQKGRLWEPFECGCMQENDIEPLGPEKSSLMLGYRGQSAAMHVLCCAADPYG